MKFEELTTTELEAIKRYSESIITFCEDSIEIANALNPDSKTEYKKGALAVTAILKGDIRTIDEILEERA